MSISIVDFNSDPMTVRTINSTKEFEGKGRRVKGYWDIKLHNNLHRKYTNVGALIRYRYANDDKWKSRTGYVSFGLPKDTYTNISGDAVYDTFGIPDSKIIFYTSEQELASAIESHGLGYKGIGVDQELIVLQLVGFHQRGYDEECFFDNTEYAGGRKKGYGSNKK